MAKITQETQRKKSFLTAKILEKKTNWITGPLKNKEHKRERTTERRRIIIKKKNKKKTPKKNANLAKKFK